MNKSVEKLYESQRASLIKESEKIGLRIKEIQDISMNQDKAIVGSAFKAVVGGSLKPDHIQCFQFENHQFYIQPYSGLTCLPGEHYSKLNGAFGKPLLLQSPIIGKPKWKIPGDKQSTKELHKNHSNLLRISKGTKMEWPIGMGSVDLDWGFQLISPDPGSSFLIMQAGRYGGFTTYEVGFRHFTNVKIEISKLLSKKESSIQKEIYPLQYFDLVKEIIK